MVKNARDCDPVIPFHPSNNKTAEMAPSSCQLQQRCLIQQRQLIMWSHEKWEIIAEAG